MKMDCMAIFGILLLLNWIAAIRLRRCINDQYINIDEDSQDPVICDLDSNETVTWYLSAEKSPDPTLLGECGPSKTEVMCSSSYDNVVITRSATQSNLTILRNQRDFSKNTVTCSYGHVNSGYSCQMRVVHRATPKMCNIFIHKEGTVAKLYGSCYIEKTYVSDAHYSCIWHCRYPNQTGEPQPLPSVFITTPYTDAGRDYVKSTCAFSSRVFTVNGTYKIYFSFNPGPDKQEIGTIDIPYTVDQWQTITKPLTFPATGSNQLALTCNSASKIDPPIWSGTTCSHGNTGQTCTSTPDPSSDEGKIVMCSAYFPKQPFASTTVNASFRLNLTPPSAPVIAGYQPGQVVSVGDTLVMTCSVHGGDPLVTSITFHCGSTADGLDKRNTTHVSSQVTIRSVRADHNGTLCVCKALWPKDEQLELNRNVTLLIEAAAAATVKSVTVNGKTGSMTVNSGDSTPLILRCAAIGWPKPSIRVVRVDTGQPLEVDTSHTSGQDENVQQYTLTTSARCQDAAIYRCEAGNTEGKDQREFSLFVNCAPLQGDKGTVQNPLHLFVMDGTQSMTFSIVAFPTPLVSIVFLGSSLLVDDNSEQGKASDVLNARCVPTATVFQSACTVTADKPGSEDEGFYNVTVRNNFGEASYIVQLSLAQSAVARDSKSAFPAAAVGGGVAAAVAVAALVVVGVIVYRKYFGSDTYDRPMPRQQEDNYTDLVLYEDVGNKQVQTGTDHTYENDAAI